MLELITGFLIATLVAGVCELFGYDCTERLYGPTEQTQDGRIMEEPVGCNSDPLAVPREMTPYMWDVPTGRCDPKVVDNSLIASGDDYVDY